MEQVIESYMELFGTAVEQEDFDKAADYLAMIRELYPDSPVLEAGEGRLAAARQARTERLAEQERQRIAQATEAHWAELKRQRQAEAERHAGLFEVAMQEGKLQKAANHLTQIRAKDPDSPVLGAAEQRLADAREVEQERQRQEEEVELERQRRESDARVRVAVGEMVSISGGSFRMGNLKDRKNSREAPIHSVTVPSFKLGKYEVTFAQWDACVADGGCGRYTPDDEGWGRGKRPVMNVSWADIQGFIDWLNAKTGGNFRLPSEAEWEYAARAGSTTKYHFGNSESELCRYGNHADSSTDFDWRNKSCSDGVGKRTAAVGRYQPNAFGLYDLHGNVYEWVADCLNYSYAAAPSDGRAWTLGDCSQRVRRGGSWYYAPRHLRSASRFWSARSVRSGTVGFRLAQDK